MSKPWGKEIDHQHIVKMWGEERKTVIVKHGEYYGPYTYKADNFFNGQFGCVISKDIEEVKSIVGDVEVINLGK
ncbi:hypothetical protein [Evansella tamaricis]|uniref:Uncharacterized protein n=1 Tax=Evansella tamaricis TaxID=2069301 RepID=A0ABS6JM49_9BACI|nr:hypothetical protein [Evansella tamaricis]MBU9714435.1 hypothetical protein [Evansella tamaricis]